MLQNIAILSLGVVIGAGGMFGFNTYSDLKQTHEVVTNYIEKKETQLEEYKEGLSRQFTTNLKTVLAEENKQREELFKKYESQFVLYSDKAVQAWADNLRKSPESFIISPKEEEAKERFDRTMQSHKLSIYNEAVEMGLIKPKEEG